MLIDMARYLAKFVFFFISEIIIKCDLAVSRQHCHWLTVITVAKHNFSLLWMLMTTKHRDHLRNTLKGPPWDLWNWTKLIKVTRNHDQKHKKVTKDSETKTMKSICLLFLHFTRIWLKPGAALQNLPGSNNARPHPRPASPLRVRFQFNVTKM